MHNTASAAESAVHQQVSALLDDAARSRVGDAEASSRLALEARVLARTHGQPSLEAQALYHLASIAHQQGRPEDAFALASEAIALAQPNEVSLTAAWALHLIGEVHYQASNAAEALETCQRALEV